ncbi:MAG TPA: HAD family hydrolase [Rhodanobacteraceae bacterium]|nr:HAD family hydrolase [Rhodanobacteraceae bacterium]
MTTRRALFLDKDGVINVDHGYVCTPERTDFIDGIFEMCRAATQRGYLNVVVTNQAGIARGYYSEQDFTAYMDWMRDAFRLRDAQLDAVYYCPHHPVHGMGEYLRDCDCRKPKPGMIASAARDLDIELSKSILLGDTASDIEAGKAAGVGRCLSARIVLQHVSSRPMFEPAFVRVVTDLLDAESTGP